MELIPKKLCKLDLRFASPRYYSNEFHFDESTDQIIFTTECQCKNFSNIIVVIDYDHNLTYKITKEQTCNLCENAGALNYIEDYCYTILRKYGRNIICDDCVHRFVYKLTGTCNELYCQDR